MKLGEKSNITNCTEYSECLCLVATKRKRKKTEKGKEIRKFKHIEKEKKALKSHNTFLFSLVIPKYGDVGAIICVRIGFALKFSSR